MSTKAVKVCCQGCGADLQTSDAIRFVTCNFCGSRLEIVRDPTTTHTRLLDEIHRKTEHLEDKLRVLELQNELEFLDRNWDRYRESCLTRSPDGSYSEPDSATSQVLGVASLILGGVILVFCLFNWNGGQTSFGVICSFAFIGFGAFHLTHGAEKARSHEGAKMSYSTRRSRIVNEIRKIRSER